MIAYLDSSVLLRYLFKEASTLKEMNKIKKAVSSILLKTECFRCLDRARVRFGLSNEEIAQKHQEIVVALKSVFLIQLDSLILERAGEAFPTTLGTLDAIHLASALFYREQFKENFIFTTHDQELGAAARALSFQVLGI